MSARRFKSQNRMERTKNLDRLISKMADPALMNKLCRTYNKKQSFKYKDKANIHYGWDNNKCSFFNETEECLKLLGFLDEESVTNPNYKQERANRNFEEFVCKEGVKNCIDVIQKLCQTTDNKRGQQTNFSKKRRRKIKSNVNSVVTLSSDGSENELIQKSATNEFKTKTSRVVNKKKSCAKSKSSEVLNGCVVPISNKTKRKTMVQNKHNSPKSKEPEPLVISETEKAFLNKKGNKTKNTAGNKLHSMQKNSLLKPCVIKPFSGSAASVEKDIITISSNSSTDSDEDFCAKKDYKGAEKKFEVLRSKSKNVKIREKFVSVHKSLNSSESMFCKSSSTSTLSSSVDSDANDEVSLLDPDNLSKCDPSTDVEENPTSSKMPSANNLSISKQNNWVNNVKELGKTSLINRNNIQDVNKKKINLKMAGNKPILPTKSAGNSDHSFKSNHSDNSSNALYNSNVMSEESDDSSDEVLFQGVYKSVDSNAYIEGYILDKNRETSEKGTVLDKQSNDLENPEKARKVCNIICDEDRSVASNSLGASVESCIGNDEDVEEIYIGNNFGKEMVNAESIPSKQNELMKSKLDFVPEPVDFEIPPLHEKESVYQPSKEDLARWKRQGLKIKKGRWTPEEDEILKRNLTDFSGKYGIYDPCVIFGIYSDHKYDDSILRFLRAKHFYARLGKDLNDRTLVSIYYRARLIFHPYASNKKWSSEDISKLMHLHKIFGSNWNKIGQILKKPGDFCHTYFKEYNRRKSSSILSNKKHYKKKF